jgi:hypothetical protein
MSLKVWLSVARGYPGSFPMNSAHIPLCGITAVTPFHIGNEENPELVVHPTGTLPFVVPSSKSPLLRAELSVALPIGVMPSKICI